MLPLTLDTVRLSLHVLAATVWVGGQLTLVGLLPGLRALVAVGGAVGGSASIAAVVLGIMLHG